MTSDFLTGLAIILSLIGLVALLYFAQKGFDWLAKKFWELVK